VVIVVDVDTRPRRPPDTAAAAGRPRRRGRQFSAFRMQGLRPSSPDHRVDWSRTGRSRAERPDKAQLLGQQRYHAAGKIKLPHFIPGYPALSEQKLF